MSEEEKERREIENRKRRIKRTKRIVNSRDSRKESNGEQGRKVDVAERLRAKMERKLNKRTAQLRADERSKAREREHEKRVGKHLFIYFIITTSYILGTRRNVNG